MNRVAPAPETQDEQPARPRLIAVMPAYNEAPTIVGVLRRLAPLVDEIVVVDDGSADGTWEAVWEWARERSDVRLIRFDRNRGMSAAYYAAFAAIGERVAGGDLSPDDVVLTVDADGQHEPADIERLVARLQEGFDAVIARRDFALYTAYKRLGNWLMSLWGSLWAGQRLYDVESGFRAFRAGALLDALRFYRGYKYSETVEVAVILPHLGYRVCNDLPVPIPVYRSNPRLKDFVIDLIAMPAAWWRVMAARRRPVDMPGWSIYTVPAVGLLGLLLIVIDLLAHPVFLADDSMHHYAHIWYVSQQLFEHARIPLHMASLDSGRAMAFPYGLPVYLLGALLFRAFDNFALVLMMAVATLGTVWAAGLARPVMRDPWFILLFVLNPFFIDAVYAFQFTSIWSAFFFFLFVWAFERRRNLAAAVLLWLTISSHTIMGTFAVGAYGLWLVAYDRPSVRRLVLLSAPVGVALIPVYWMTLLTPAVHENSVRTIVLSVLDTVSRRFSIIVFPFLFTYAAPLVRRSYRLSLGVFAVAGVVGVVMAATPVGFHDGSYYGALHRSHDIYAAFFDSPAFQPGAVYRVVEPNEREDGMYRFVRRGAILSNEFFSESTARWDFTPSQYGCYASLKGIDYVAIEKAYLEQFHRNEEDVLRGLVRDGTARVTYADPAGRYTVYDIRAFTAAQPKPGSLDQCGIFP